MSRRSELVSAAVETLPITVAVISDEGEILLTNRSWREFGPDDDPDDHVGVDYIAAATTDDDEHARRAVDGLERVIAGERETFAMEYPCHSPQEKRWFLMRANRFTVDGEVRASVIHLDITDRKLAELAAEESAEQLRAERRTLERVLERVDGLVRDVTDAVGAGTRDEIERRVCGHLVDVEPYEFAWIGRVDVTGGRIAPSEWGGRIDATVEDDLLLAPDGSHPAVRALETSEPQIVQGLERTASGGDRDWSTCVGADEAVRSMAALPLIHGEVTHGVVVVFATEPDAFEDREVLVLESLAGTIGTAVNAIETRRMLTSEAVVELEVAIEDPSLIVTTLARELEATVSYRGQTYDGDGTPLLYLYVGRTDGVADAAARVDGVTAVTVLSEREDGTLLELTLTDGLVTRLADHGAVIRRLDTDENVVDLTLEMPNSQSARSAFNLLDDRLNRVELISYQEIERPSRTPRDLAARLESTLTDRQLLALRKAYVSDYFEWPRAVSGEELAESMGITRSTFHQHLRSAQAKLLDELFDGDRVVGRQTE
ncbi:bacterio-opsin activator domain-containing protein [Natrarchaeobius oligotrophus]|uniref:Histidine kinase n=1 Tax=Natrarchaeobius chitinivorans TaxID=1679083 RepID=A0A3N6MTT4_NATCH|nr:bacterio-opsin activator domain-containing protein [Natrarchaeobius chitinivorans]RQH01321.1 histidine kinase [Natrarchaeobius chitinivorans]